MKIPLTFVTEKNLDQKIEALLQESESVHGYNTLAVGSLAAYSKEFLKGKVEDYDSNYKKALRLTKGLSYTLKDVEELSKRIGPGEDETLGIYLSAVINRKIRKKDEVVLSPNGLLTGLGMYLRKGTVIIEGDTRNATGRCMKGGKVIVKGSVRNDTGESMEDGEI
ncbi:MAG: hypothetical protein Q8N77_04760, partial [Nanoarchaeota archaeon]|nr:hypothetical protein [Nanoarchaeota archaeon]